MFLSLETDRYVLESGTQIDIDAAVVVTAWHHQSAGSKGKKHHRIKFKQKT